MQPYIMPPLTTPRLLLRRFEPGDGPAAFAAWCSDGEVSRFLRWPTHTDVSQSEEFVRSVVTGYAAEDNWQWLITLRETGEVLGGISLLMLNAHDACGEVGYCLGRRWWGRGIMTEALRAVLDFAFETAGFNRVEACHSLRNPASGRVMQKAGMRPEGVARQKYRSNLGFEDSAVYAALKQDRDETGAI